MAVIISPAHNSASPFAGMRGHHVGARTPDLETVKSWYVEKLDFRLVAEGGYQPVA
jgi:glyoxylase I family protein